MPRPRLDERLTIRLPKEILDDCLSASCRRSCSVNEVVLSALENELARTATYHLDYYRDLRPLVRDRQGDIVRQRQTLSAMKN